MDIPEQLLNERQYLTLLQVCHESRDEVLRFFKPCRIANKSLYFDFELDLFRIHSLVPSSFTQLRRRLGKEANPNAMCGEAEFRNLCFDIQRISFTEIWLAEKVRVGTASLTGHGATRRVCSADVSNDLICWTSTGTTGRNALELIYPLPQLQHLEFAASVSNGLIFKITKHQMLLERDGLEVFVKKFVEHVKDNDPEIAAMVLENVASKEWRLSVAKSSLKGMRMIVDREFARLQKAGKSCIRPSLSVLYPATAATAEWLMKLGGDLQYGFSATDKEVFTENSDWEMVELSEADLCHEN